jgi:hypothetical protein
MIDRIQAEHHLMCRTDEHCPGLRRGLSGWDPAGLCGELMPMMPYLGAIADR